MLVRCIGNNEVGKGGDQDALQRAQRLVLEITSELEQADDASAWPKLELRVNEEIAKGIEAGEQSRIILAP